MTIQDVADLMLTSGFSLHQAQDELTKQLLEAALRKTQGNKVRAAKLLQLHRNTFDRNLHHHKVNWKSFRWPTSRSKSQAAAASTAG